METPSHAEIEALRAAVEEHVTGSTVREGHYDAYWEAKDKLEDTQVAYLLANPPQPVPYLRDKEQLVEIVTSEHERHCHWGHLGGKLCRKPVVQIRWRWEPEFAKQHNAEGVQNGWRHADGSSLHDYPDDMGECYTSCEPISLCTGCGQEFLGSHCDVCHTNDALEVKHEAYGNRTRCTTPGCTRKESYYPIGD